LKPTLNHGDLHSENIFWDDKNQHLTLIDNETFALSVKHPSSGVNDIVEFYMLHTVHTVAHAVSSQLTTNEEFGINDALWHELWRSLFYGYLTAYNPTTPAAFSKLFEDFHKEFMNGLSQFRMLKNLRDFTDQRKLKRFGPSIRRSKIKHHELKETFDRLYQQGIARFNEQVASS
jgi:hypothetical protein